MFERPELSRGSAVEQPGPENGYRTARYLRDTPYTTMREWRRAMVDAIPEDERCSSCKGDGRHAIYAGNGGLSEFERCWPCEGTGRKRRA